METFSRHKKLNNALNGIIEQFKYAFPECYKEETIRYMKEFKTEIDYNIAQYGNLLIYYTDIRKFYDKCGYKTRRYSDIILWERYKRQVGYIARYIAKNNKEI